MSIEGAKPVKLMIWNTTSKTWEKFDGSITAGDIEIGQVELKDSDSAAQGNIKAANTARTTATVVLAVQAIDAAGAVLDTSSLATSANQLANDHDVTVSNPTADPETGLATSALQLADGHNVTVDNAAGAGVYVRPGTSAVFTTAANKASSATSTAVSVGSSSTTVLASNANRKQAILVNDSDEEMYLKYGSGATVNSGLRLNSYGGTLVETVYTGIVTGITASGSKVISVLEA